MKSQIAAETGSLLLLLFISFYFSFFLEKIPILRLANKETETKLHRTVETGGKGGPSSKEKGGKLSQRWDFLTSPIVEIKLKKEKEKNKTAKCVTHKGPDEKAQNKRNDRRRKKTKKNYGMKILHYSTGRLTEGQRERGGCLVRK